MLTRQIGSRIISPQRQVADTDGFAKPKEQSQNMRISVAAQRRMSLSSQMIVAVQQDDSKTNRSAKSAQAVQDEKNSQLSEKQERKETPLKHACTKCKNKCVAFWLALISNFLLLFLVAAYSVMGGFLFQFLELKKHTLPKDQFRFMEYRRMTTVYKLLGITRTNTNLTLDIGFQWAKSLDKVLEEYQIVVMEETGRQMKAEKIEWTFMSSIMYSVTLITSIGYGHLTPNTSEGRIATIFYSIIGIPLALLYLTSIGRAMANIFKFSYNRFASYVWHIEAKKYGDPTIRVPVAVTLTFIIFYNALGVFLFSVWEKQWTPIISAYFCFITLSTIGLGDFVFGFDDNHPDPSKQLVGALYLVLGLSVMSMGFNLMKDEIISKYRWVIRRLTKIKRSKPKEPVHEVDSLSELF